MRRRERGGESTVEVRELSEFDPLPHRQDKSSTGQTVQQHPDISRVQAREFGGRFMWRGRIIRNRSTDVGPGGNNRR